MERVWVSSGWGPRKSDAWWLGLAVLLHVLVLAIPVAERMSALETVSVTVSLFRPAPPAPELAPEEDAPPPEPVELTASRRTLPDLAPPQARVPEPPPPSASQLVESVRRLELFPREERSRRLGEFVPPPAPRNWQPAILPEENRFDGMILPEKTEVVDRWLAADGSHNVVIRTPGGVTLCGRALPWSPMQPLVEHVMMFRSCAGGGKRSFDMPERYKRARP